MSEPSPDRTKGQNPFRSSSNKRVLIDRLGHTIFAIATYAVILCTLLIFWDITRKGLPVMSWDFLSKSPETLVVFELEGTEGIQKMDYTDYSKFKEENPNAPIINEHTHSYSGGGVLGPLVGTALLVIVCMVVALFTGVSAAIFLNEYARHGRFLNMVRLAIMNLAGVPSIVFGLFGLGVFCLSPWFPVLTYAPTEHSALALAVPFSKGYLSFQGWGNSILAGGFTLAIMVLPVIITACEESLKAVPMGFREASLALGATKWQSIRTAVLPYATPGIMTASVLGVTRVAGETAPIMFTAALAHKAGLPWEEARGNGIFWLSDFFTQSVQALPYHIYTVSARIPQSEYTEPMQNGSVFVFMVLVMAFSSLSMILRARYRKKLKW